MNEFFFEFANLASIDDMVVVRLHGLMCLLLLSHHFFSTKIHYRFRVKGLGLKV